MDTVNDVANMLLGQNLRMIARVRAAEAAAADVGDAAPAYPATQ